MENTLSTCLKNNIKNYPFKKAWKQKTRAIRITGRNYSKSFKVGPIEKLLRFLENIAFCEQKLFGLDPITRREIFRVC